MTVYNTLPVLDIVREYQTGSSLQAVANAYNTSYGTVRRILAAAGVPIRQVGRNVNVLNAPTHKITPDFAIKKTWAEMTEALPKGTLHPLEVDRLRRAVGWKPEWAE